MTPLPSAGTMLARGRSGRLRGGSRRNGLRWFGTFRRGVSACVRRFVRREYLRGRRAWLRLVACVQDQADRIENPGGWFTGAEIVDDQNFHRANRLKNAQLGGFASRVVAS